jgi:hypothetical protein
MKRLLITLVITSIISFLFGNYIFKTYKDNLEMALESVSSLYDTVYMLQYGSYKNKDKAMDNKLKYFAMEEENGYYKVYVGVTSSLDNAEKIKGIHRDLGNDIYIKEKSISNLEFIDILNNYDASFKDKSNDEILSIEEKIINKYKELILNE